jgi:alcohol dehydrogenase class IV
MIAKVVIIDPEITIGVPADITAYTGMDTLCHLIEAYVSINSNIVTDALCIQGLRLVKNALVNVFTDGKDIGHRSQMALASLLGGIVLANAGLGAVHGLAASIGGRYPGLPHGLICGILLPYVMKYNADTVAHKYTNIIEIFAPDERNMPVIGVVDIIKQLLVTLKIPVCLHDIGIKKEDIPAIVSGVSSSVQYNPKPVENKELSDILDEAISG